MRTIRSNTLAWFIAPMAFVLSGCGGGGGGGPATVSPAYSTLQSLTNAATFATVGAVFNFYRPDTPSPIYTAVGATVSIAYDPADKSYSLTGTPSGSTTRTSQTFGPADLQTGGVYSQSSTSADGTTSSGSLSLSGNSPTQQTSANANTNTYSGMGEWENGSSNNNGVQNFNSYEFAYGIGTEAGDLPHSGSATYSLVLHGQDGLAIGGSGSLTVNFAAGTLTLSLTPADLNVSEDGVSSQTPITTLTGSGSVDFTTNSFSANVTSPSYIGVVTGLFYGPQGVKAGAAFTMNPIAGVQGAIAAGSALGKKQ